jgi:hypothetical protein
VQPADAVTATNVQTAPQVAEAPRVTVAPDASTPDVSTPGARPPGASADDDSAAVGAVVFEPVDPTRLMRLIEGSQIRVGLPASPRSDAPVLVFDEATGMMVARTPVTARPTLLTDDFGEEWLLVSGAALPSARLGPLG